MINFWKLAYKSVKEQRDELQLQNIGLKKELNYRNESYTELFEAYERLERENEKLKEELLQCDYVKASVLGDREEYKNRIVELTKENKALRLQSDTYFEQWQNEKLKGED